MDNEVIPHVRAFLSHASEDKADFVEPLARQLAEMGVAPWLDIWEIRPGDSLVKKLFDEGLDTVDAVIVVVSVSSATKPWVREELDAAVVRRITSSARLIPVRLDNADMPAPLKHLVWIPAERTPEGIRSAAAQITDALYGRELRPAVGPPPAYITAASIPGLTAADSALLAVFIEEALANQNLALVWPIIKEKAEARGLTGAVLEEAFAALQQRRCLEIKAVAGGPHTVELTSIGFQRGIDTVVPNADAARKQIIAILVNNPPTGNQAADELADATGTPVLFVRQFLRQLDTEGYLHFTGGLGGLSRIVGISPTLSRLV
jgi:hypothetical protein